MTSTKKGGEGVLKFVMCLWILLFLNNRSIVHFCGWWGWGVKKLCGFKWWIKWLNQKEIDRFNVNSIEKNSSIDYILEVYLEYPSELHDLHNDYPLALERLKISQNMLPNYCFNIANQ